MTRSFLLLTVFAWHVVFAGCKSLKPHCMPVEYSLKVERLKAKTAAAKQQLSDPKDRQRHKRELERIRKEHERETKKAATNEAKSTQGRVALLDAKGEWIGWIETQANGNVNVYDARGPILRSGRRSRPLTRDLRPAAQAHRSSPPEEKFRAQLVQLLHRLVIRTRGVERHPHRRVESFPSQRLTLGRDAAKSVVLRPIVIRPVLNPLRKGQPGHDQVAGHGTFVGNPPGEFVVLLLKTAHDLRCVFGNEGDAQLPAGDQR